MADVNSALSEARLAVLCFGKCRGLGFVASKFSGCVQAWSVTQVKKLRSFAVELKHKLWALWLVSVLAVPSVPKFESLDTMGSFILPIFIPPIGTCPCGNLIDHGLSISCCKPPEPPLSSLESRGFVKGSPHFFYERWSLYLDC